MKKTISVSIADTLFYVEEDAYAELDKYLRSIREHFASYPDRDEIVADIEQRISERFGDENERKSRIVTRQDVEALVEAMGTAEDFGDEPSPEKLRAASQSGQPKEKKLYRDIDNAVIGGVCAGIAAYLGIDVVIVRLLFIVSIFFGGTGVVVYLALWLAMPEAVTPTEKLRMKGSPVTLESVTRVIEEKVDEVRANAQDGRISRFTTGIARAAERIARAFARGIVPVFGKIVGIFLAIAATIAFVAVSVALFSVLINFPSPNIDFPLGESIRGPLFYTLVASSYVVVAIPVAFLFFLAVTLIRGRNAFSGRVAFPLLALWLISSIVFGVTAVRSSALHAVYVRSNPDYETRLEEFELKDFTGVSAQNGSRIILSQGGEYHVAAEGRKRDIDSLAIRIDEDTLFVGRKENTQICIFCFRNPVTVRVTVPSLSSIKLANGSSVETEGLITGAELSVELMNSSRANLEASLSGNLNVLLANGSAAEFEGKADSLTAILKNSSRLDSLSFAVDGAKLELENFSQAKVSASSTLEVTVENASRVDFAGDPIVTERIENGSRIRSI